MNRFLRRILPALLLAALPCLPVQAGNLPEFANRFFRGLATLQGDFDQQVIDANHQPVQQSQGHMWIKRPGRFRWDYHKPYEQQLVADGKKVWSWDADLEQATVQPASAVITSTPAMLLSGTAPIDQVFTSEELDDHTVLLKPRSKDSNVTDLRLEFSGTSLTGIVAHDTFGNTTTFRFSHLARNAPIADDTFRFVPPPGADVIGADP
jgi:outer membrane lipoprotein carrier protein